MAGAGSGDPAYFRRMDYHWLLVAFGAALLAALVGLSVFYENRLEDDVRERAVLKSKTDPQYESWLTNSAENPEATPEYKKFYFFNITNPDAVASGATPAYREVGPYVYRRNSVKFDVLFNRDKVSYKEYVYYTFESSQSVGNPETDNITSINSVYYKARELAGGTDHRVLSRFVRDAIQTTVDLFDGPFLDRAKLVFFKRKFLLDQSSFLTKVEPFIRTFVTQQLITRVFENARVIGNASLQADYQQRLEDARNDPNGDPASVAAPTDEEIDNSGYNIMLNDNSFITNVSLPNRSPVVEIQGFSYYANKTLEQYSSMNMSTYQILFFGSNSQQAPGLTRAVGLHESSFSSGFKQNLRGFLDQYDNTTLREGSMLTTYNLTSVQLSVLHGWITNHIMPKVVSALGVPIADEQASWFRQQWTNASILPTSFQGFELGVPFNSSFPPSATNITDSVALQLLNESVSESPVASESGCNSGSSISSCTVVTWGGGKGVAYWNATVSGRKAELMGQFGLSSANYDAVEAWITSYANTSALEFIRSWAVVTENSDLKYRQWGASDISRFIDGDLTGRSVYNLYPELHSTNSTYMSYRNDPPPALTLAQAKGILLGSFKRPTADALTEGNASTPTTSEQSTGDATVPVTLGMLDDDWETVSSFLNLQVSDANALANWAKVFDGDSTSLPTFAIVIAFQYLEYLIDRLVIPHTLGNILRDGAGLIATRKVHDWLFNAEDSLVKYFQSPSLPPVPSGLETNMTSWANANELNDGIRNGFFTYNTGADVEMQLGDISRINGVRDVTIYSQPLRVKGVEGRQFPPLDQIAEAGTYQVFDPVFQRNTNYQAAGKSAVQGISTFRYRMTTDSLAAGTVYNQSANGLVPLTGFGRGPLFVSRPYFDGVDASALPSTTTSATVERGSATQTFSAAAAASDTHSELNVDSFTGQTLLWTRKYQYSVLVNATDRFYAGVPTMYAPVVWVEESAEMSTTQKANYDNRVQYWRDLSQSLLWAGIGAGGGLFLIAAYITGRRLRDHRRERRGLGPAKSQGDHAKKLARKMSGAFSSFKDVLGKRGSASNLAVDAADGADSDDSEVDIRPSIFGGKSTKGKGKQADDGEGGVFVSNVPSEDSAANKAGLQRRTSSLHEIVKRHSAVDVLEEADDADSAASDDYGTVQPLRRDAPTAASPEPAQESMLLDLSSSPTSPSAPSVMSGPSGRSDFFARMRAQLESGDQDGSAPSSSGAASERATPSPAFPAAYGLGSMEPTGFGRSSVASERSTREDEIRRHIESKREETRAALDRLRRARQEREQQHGGDGSSSSSGNMRDLI